MLASGHNTYKHKPTATIDVTAVWTRMTGVVSGVSVGTQA